MAPVCRKLLPVCIAFLLLSVSLSFILRDRPRRRQDFQDALELLRQQRHSYDRRPSLMDLETSYYADTARLDDDDYRDAMARILGSENSYFPYQENSIPDSFQRQTVADAGELEDILKDDDGNEVRDKKTIPYQIGGPRMAKRGRGDPDVDDDDVDDADDVVEEIEKLSPSEVQDLLDEAKKVEEDALEDADEDEEDLDSVHEVSQEEIKNVLEDDDDIENNEDKDEGQSIEINEESIKLPGQPIHTDVQIHKAKWPPFRESNVDLNKEQLDSLMQDAMLIGLKSKRSGKLDVVDEVIDEADIDTPESDDGLAKEYIKEFIDLEDEENTNLANALNLATLGQVERTDKYIGKEADFIREAIKDEEDIQKMKHSLEDVDEGDEDVDLGEGRDVVDEEQEMEEDEEEPELLRKRMDPGFDIPDEFDEEDDNMLADDGAVVADEEDNIIDDDDDTEELRELLKSRLQEYLEKTREQAVPYDVDDDWSERLENRPIDEEQYLNPLWSETYDNYRNNDDLKRSNPLDEVENDLNSIDLYPGEDNTIQEAYDEDEADEGEVENALQNYISHLDPYQRRELENVLNEKIEEIIEDECPAIGLIDDCAIAAEYDLNIDDEARDLCNRHQLCYICGAAHGIYHYDCDAGFLGEAVGLCDRELNPGQCRREALAFFDLLTKKHEWRLAREAPLVCKATCTKELIVGLNE